MNNVPQKHKKTFQFKQAGGYQSNQKMSNIAAEQPKSNLETDKEFSKQITHHSGFKDCRSMLRKTVEITQYPIIKTSPNNNSNNLLSLGVFIDKHDRLNIECLVSKPFEITYCS